MIDSIVLKKYEARDIFTGQSENLIDYKDKKVFFFGLNICKIILLIFIEAVFIFK